MPNILTIILEASDPSLALQSQSNQTEAPKNNCYFQKLLLKIQNLHQNSNHNRAVCLARKRRPSIGPLVHWILPTQNIRPNEFATMSKQWTKKLSIPLGRTGVRCQMSGATSTTAEWLGATSFIVVFSLRHQLLRYSSSRRNDKD